MSDNIQEAEVGSGTKVADTKQSEKRAQLTLKAIQLRMKQEKERAALQQQKKSLSVKEETMTESFSPSQIAALKAEYSKINGIDPSSDTYKKLIAMLDKLDLKSLQSLAGAEIKFVSMLAKNRVMSKSMKKEEVEQIEEDEEMTQKKKEQVVTVKHKDSGKELRIVKTAVADYQKRGYHPVKEQGMAEGMNDWALKDKPKAKSIPQTSGMNNWARKDIHNKAYDFPPTYYDKDGKDMYGRKKPELKAQTEGVVDKIKAIKRGLEARAKASDHFDKAMDTKSPDASKHLKKAVRYHNLLNKEETEIVTEAKKKSFKDVKKKMKEEEMPSKATIKKGDMLTGKREPIEINPELKEPSR